MNTKKYAFCVAEDINLGVGYIIAHLKKQGHEVRLFFDPRQFARGYARNGVLAKLLSVEDYNIKQIKEYNPDVICFSCVTAVYVWALQLARKLKLHLPQTKMVFGGVHATLVPEEVKKNEFIDEVVVGDGLEYFGGKFEPDTLYPDREIFFKELPPEHRKIQLFMTSFGCPYNCSFCGNEQLRKVKQFKYIRRKVKGCIDELKHIKDSGAKYILFVDDVFTTDKHFLTNFSSQYKQHIGLPYACFIHANAVDKDVVRLLKDSGCHTAWMGIQTGSEDLRKRILNRHETNAQIVEAAKLVKDAGIKLMIDHIFGIPHESNMTNDVSYGLYNHIKPDIVNCYELLYFPKAKIIDHAIDFGYLTTMDIPRINRGEGIVYQQGNRASHFFDIYAKGMVSIPIGGIEWELLPTTLIKLIAHIKAGRAFMPIVIIQNEIYFTVKAILKKLRIL